MGLIDVASYASAWRGYDYYKKGKVCCFKQVGENEYIGKVNGSQKEPYSVHIDILHPKRSVCDCQFAEGSRKVCKHKVALFFTVFPGEADKYLEEIEQAEKEAEEYEEKLNDLVEEKIAKMKKSELQDALWWALTESPDWVFERFAREYIIDL